MVGVGMTVQTVLGGGGRGPPTEKGCRQGADRPVAPTRDNDDAEEGIQ